MSLVADTDVLIDFLKGKEPGASRVEAELRDGHLVTTAITAFELLAGLKAKKQAHAVDVLLDGLHIWPMDLACARQAAEVRLTLEHFKRVARLSIITP